MPRQLLGVILIGLVWSTALHAESVNPADLAGDWVIALDAIRRDVLSPNDVASRRGPRDGGLGVRRVKTRRHDSRREAGAEAVWKRWATSDHERHGRARRDGRRLLDRKT